MAKLENEPTVASVWPNSQSFADRARKAVPDRLLADIVADGQRSHYPQDRAAHTPTPPPPAAPGYVEWCRLRLGVEWSYERAKDYYHTQKTAGRDVGPIADERAPGRVAHGWVEPPKVSDWKPPGLDIMDRMMTQQDAIDRRARERLLGGK